MLKNWNYFLSAPDKKPETLILLLHGCGGNAGDIMPFADMLKKELPGQSFVAVAPDGFLPSAEKHDGYQWFDIENNYHPDLFEKPHKLLSANECACYSAMEKGIKESSKELNAFLDFCQEKFGLSDSRTVIAGYSQGGMAALDMGLSRAGTVKKIISISGCAVPPFPETFKQRCLSKPEVTLIHGTKDKVIHFNSAKQTEELLKENGISARLVRLNGMTHGRGAQAALFWSKAAYETARSIKAEGRQTTIPRHIRRGEER